MLITTPRRRLAVVPPRAKLNITETDWYEKLTRTNRCAKRAGVLSGVGVSGYLGAPLRQVSSLRGISKLSAYVIVSRWGVSKLINPPPLWRRITSALAVDVVFIPCGDASWATPKLTPLSFTLSSLYTDNFYKSCEKRGIWLNGYKEYTG